MALFWASLEKFDFFAISKSSQAPGLVDIYAELLLIALNRVPFFGFGP